MDDSDEFRDAFIAACTKGDKAAIKQMLQPTRGEVVGELFKARAVQHSLGGGKESALWLYDLIGDEQFKQGINEDIAWTVRFSLIGGKESAEWLSQLSPVNIEAIAPLFTQGFKRSQAGDLALAEVALDMGISVQALEKAGVSVPFLAKESMRVQEGVKAQKTADAGRW